MTDDVIDLTLYNQISPKASDGKFEEYGKLVIDKSSGKKTFRDEGEFTFLDREAPMIHFDFEENFAMKDRIVLGFSLRQGGNPFKSEVEIGWSYLRPFLSEPRRVRAQLRCPERQYRTGRGTTGQSRCVQSQSQMAVYGAGPHSHGNVVSYALWMKTTSKEDMILINTSRSGRRGLMNLTPERWRPGTPDCGRYAPGHQGAETQRRKMASYCGVDAQERLQTIRGSVLRRWSSCRIQRRRTRQTDQCQHGQQGHYRRARTRQRQDTLQQTHSR